MKLSHILAAIFVIVACASVAHAGNYYNPYPYAQSVITSPAPVPVYPNYYQPVQHTFDPSYALAQPYYVPYPVYVNTPAYAPSYPTYAPSTTIAVTSGVQYAKPAKVKQKTTVIHAHKKDDSFDFDFDFDFPDFHDPDSGDFEDAWDDLDEYCDEHWFC